jgi:hypothetical protein
VGKSYFGYYMEGRGTQDSTMKTTEKWALEGVKKETEANHRVKPYGSEGEIREKPVLGRVGYNKETQCHGDRVGSKRKDGRGEGGK